VATPLSQSERVYVRLPNWVGDVVLATPFLRALREAAPRAQILLHGRGHTRTILGAETCFDTFEPLQKPGWPWPVREGRRVGRLHGPFDVAFLLPNSFSSGLLARFLGARRRVGYGLNGRSWLLTDALHVKKEGRLRPVPMVDYYLGLLEHLNADVGHVPRRPLLEVPDAQRTWAEGFFARQGLAGSEPVWALNLGGAWLTKRWIPSHASALIGLLREAGVQPLLLWGPGEEDLRDAVLAGVEGAVAGADEVVPLGSLAAVLKRCQLMVSTDSGPRHFGIAAEIPVLVLIGSTHPHYTHVDYDAFDLLCEEVDCWPCHLKQCPIDFRCMQRLRAEKVHAAGQALLRRVSGQESAP
jgi:heptosyltransferase-2